MDGENPFSEKAGEKQSVALSDEEKPGVRVKKRGVPL